MNVRRVALKSVLAASLLVASLDKYKVGDDEKKDLLAFVSSLKADIVDKK